MHRLVLKQVVQELSVFSIYWDGGNNMQAAYDTKSNVLRLAGTRSGTAEELPDNTGWSTTYNNGGWCYWC